MLVYLTGNGAAPVRRINRQGHMKKGKVIILVGGSSAGKTSLAKAVQDRLAGTWCLMGIDLFWLSLPPKQLDLGRVEPQYYRWETETREGKEYFRIVPGPILDELMYGRYYAIQAYLDRGFNIIADEVLWKKEWLQECRKALAGYDIVFVHVYCDDAEGERRETLRGDRHSGWNRGSAYYSKLNLDTYGAEIDTTNNSPDECAQKLVESLSKIGWESAASSVIAQVGD
jgi:chloramphenicol 3-O phosphotransferase